VPVRIYAFSEDEITTINNFMTAPPEPEPEPEPEVVPEPVEEPEELVEAAAEPTAPEVAEEIVDDQPAAEEEPEPVEDEPKSGGVTAAVGGLLSKLRNKSRQSFTPVKATTGTPAIKKASIHDKKKPEPVAEAPAAPSAPVRPTPQRTSPLFNRGNKAVRDLDSRPKRSTDGDTKKDRPVKKRGVTANIAKMPEVKQPTARFTSRCDYANPARRFGSSRAPHQIF